MRAVYGDLRDRARDDQHLTVLVFVRHDLSSAGQSVQACHAAAKLAAAVPEAAALPLVLLHVRPAGPVDAEAVLVGVCDALEAAVWPWAAFVEPDLLDALTAVAAVADRRRASRLVRATAGVALHDGSAAGDPDRERALRALTRRRLDATAARRRRDLTALLAADAAGTNQPSAVRDGIFLAELAASSTAGTDAAADAAFSQLTPAAAAVADRWSRHAVLADRDRLTAVLTDLPAPAGTSAVPTGPAATSHQGVSA